MLSAWISQLLRSHIASCIRTACWESLRSSLVWVFGFSQVNEAEDERLRSEREHMRVTQLCQAAEARVQTLQKSLKRTIIKSKPYFEVKVQFNSILEVSSVSRRTSLGEWMRSAYRNITSFTVQFKENWSCFCACTIYMSVSILFLTKT